jgi:hypothetical protein
LQRQPAALRAIFNAHGPRQIVRRNVPRVSMAKTGFITALLPALTTPHP